MHSLVLPFSHSYHYDNDEAQNIQYGMIDNHDKNHNPCSQEIILIMETAGLYVTGFEDLQDNERSDKTGYK